MLENIPVDRGNATEHEVHKWRCFASDIGLKPGNFPKYLDTLLGNRQLFVFQNYIWYDEELVGVKYTQANGCIDLVVFND
jgi:hypothetical protein